MSLTDQEILSPCVIWDGYVGSDGYGRINRPAEKSSPQLVHKRSWEQENGPVPAGMHVHHKCGTTACYNLDHLEVVSAAEHRRKHLDITDTRCQNGHEGDLFLAATGYRACHECRREATRRWRARRAA